MKTGQIYSGKEFNTFGNKIVKALPCNLVYQGARFQLGLNILTPLVMPKSGYDDDPDCWYDEACDGGCDFYKEEAVGEHIRGRDYSVAYVTIPDDAQVYVSRSYDYMFRTDKIIIDSIVTVDKYFQDIEKYKAALQLNGSLIDLVENQTEELCKIAIKSLPESILRIKNQTIDLWKIALETDWSVFLLLEDQTPELCLVAVNICGILLKRVKEQTREICLAAVKQYGDSLEYVREQTPEICHAAYTQNKHSRCYILDSQLRAHYESLRDAEISVCDNN